MNGLPISRSEAVSNIAIDIVLTLVTCGIYNLFWQYRQFKVMNAFLGQKRYSFLQWMILVVLTCGLYHVYIQYSMGGVINEIKEHYGMKPTDNLPILSLVFTAVGFSFVVDCIHQEEINRMYDFLESGADAPSQPPSPPAQSEGGLTQSDQDNQDSFSNRKDDDNPFRQQK